MKRRISERTHIEVARGTKKMNIEYCKKEGNWFEVGKSSDERKEERRITHIRRIISADEKPEEFVLKKDESDLINTCRFNIEAIQNLWTEYRRNCGLSKIKATYRNAIWKRWQFRLLQELRLKPDDRKIIWYNDPRGNSGKTVPSRYLQCEGRIRFENG